MPYYDRNGNPMELFEWAAAMDKHDRTIAFEHVGDADVSTVWLGLDHAFFGGPPLIFETMIFGGKYDLECWRYPTEASAIAGHDQIVAALRDGEEPGRID